MTSKTPIVLSPRPSSNICSLSSTSNQYILLLSGNMALTGEQPYVCGFLIKTCRAALFISEWPHPLYGIPALI